MREDMIMSLRLLVYLLVWVTVLGPGKGKIQLEPKLIEHQCNVSYALTMVLVTISNKDCNTLGYT